MNSQTPGYSDDKEAVLKRLARIEGQVRGIARMVEDDRYCIDVLTQINAVQKEGDTQAGRLDELMEAVGRLVKS
jgi:DNA-binding FrmR family transcriptional regulator